MKEQHQQRLIMLYLAKNYIGVRMKSELYVVPPQLVHKYWHMAEPHLKLAIEKGNGEFDLNDLRYVCSRGEQQLLMVMRDDKCHCALTTIQYNFPRFRQMYISYIGGKNTKDGWQQFLDMDTESRMRQSNRKCCHRISSKIMGKDVRI